MSRYDAWFIGDDVAKVLKGLKVWPSSGDLSPDGSLLATLFQTQCDIAADAAKNEFERRTGRTPFLVTRAVLAHSATDGMGNLFLSVPAKTIYSVTSAGAAIDASTYWTQPATAALTGNPIESIQFSSNLFGGLVWSRPNQILIDADYGFASTIPPIVWQAGLHKATFDAVAAIQGESDLGSIGEDGFNMGFDLVGPVDDKTRMKYWPDEWEKAIKIYTRQVC